MSGFSFPPPPPPPPQSTSTVPPQAQYWQRGGSNSRGFRGRGRGNTRGVSGHRGNHHHQHHSQNYSPRGPPTSKPSLDSHSFGTTGTKYQDTLTNLLPHAGSSHGYVQSQRPGHSNSGHSGSPPSYPNGNDSLQSHSSFLHLGSKRTLDQAFHNGLPRATQAKPENQPKIPAPPAVPSFGFALPTMPTPSESAVGPSNQKSNKKKQRKTNLLGLTPQGDVHEDSDQDIDEEAAFAQSSESASVNYRGRSIQLNTAADVAAWIAERKKRFPTQAKVAAKKAADETMRKKAQEARESRDAEKKRRLEQKATANLQKWKEKSARKQNSTEQTKSAHKRPDNAPETSDPLARIALLEEQLRQAKEALLRGTTAESSNMDESKVVVDYGTQSGSQDQNVIPAPNADTSAMIPIEDSDVIKEQRAHLGLDYSSGDNDDEDNLSVIGSESEISSDEPSSDSSVSDSESDSEAPPDEESSRSQNTLKVAQPVKEGPNKSQVCKQFANSGKCKYGDKCMRSHEVICKYFARHGHCRYGDKCRMSHNVVPKTGKGGAAIDARPKIMSLRERLVEEELKREAEQGLRVIKQLGSVGFFKAA